MGRRFQMDDGDVIRDVIVVISVQGRNIPEAISLVSKALPDAEIKNVYIDEPSKRDD